MTAPADPADSPSAEPGKRPTDADPGAQAEPGSDSGAPAHADRPASKDRTTTPPGAQRGSARPATEATSRSDDDEDEWRHEPVAPVDERNPLRSLGKAVGETVTGSDADTASRKR